MAAQWLMCDFAIQEDAAIGVPSEALMSKHSFIFLIEEWDALVVTHDMGQIGIDDVFLALVCEVESSDGEIWLECLVFSIFKCFIWGVIPKSGIFVTVVLDIGQILNSVLSDRECHHIIGDIEIHSFFFALASSAILAIEWDLNFPSLWVETLIELKADTFLPSIEEVIFCESSELDVALIGEINKL